MRAARRPVFYGGGGLINSGPAACEAFAQLVHALGAPCTLTLMGLGAFPGSDPQFLGMLGMHGTLEANLAMHHADLVICVGARFDDRVTGRLDDFCPSARKIHLDIDPSSINKLVHVDVALVGDCGAAAGRAARGAGHVARRYAAADAVVDHDRRVARAGLPRLLAARGLHPAAAPDACTRHGDGGA